MQMLKILGTICLIFTSVIDLSSSVEDVEFLSSECTEPLEYYLNIHLNANDQDLMFDSLALINVTCTIPEMILYFGECKIMNFVVNSFIEDNSKGYTIKRSFSEKENRPIYIISENNLQREADGMSVVETKTNVSPGKYWIESRNYCPSLQDIAEVLIYTNKISDEDKRSLIFSRIPNKWLFPYWINPEKQAIFNITIKYDNSDIYMALSHTSVNGTDTNKNNKHIDHFHTTPAMSTHLLALALLSDDLSPTYVNNFYAICCKSEIVNDIQYAKSIIQSVTDHICKNWKDLSCIKTRYIIHHNQKHENAITVGLVFLKDSDIVYNSQSVPIRKRDVTMLVARSVIQEMFSNWMATYRQSDLWFTEGFSTYYGTLQFLDKIDKGEKNVYVIQKRSQFLNDIDTFHYGLRYQSNEFYKNSLIHFWKAKAFSFFYMIDNYYESSGDYIPNFVTDMIFKEAKNIYYNTDGYINNKQPTLDNIWNKINTYEKLAYIQEIMNSWITQEGYPIIKVIRNDGNSVTIKIVDCILVTNVTHNKMCKWMIPLTFIIGNGINKNILEVDKHFTDVDDNKLVVLLDITGCRVNYDRKLWKNIIHFMRIHKLNEINEVNRAQLLDDALYFLIKYPEKEISTDTNNNNNNNDKSDDNYLTIFFDLANTLLNNESYLEWYPMFSALEHASTIFPYDTDIKNKFAAILDKANDVMKKAEDLDFEKNFENTIINQLRHEVVKWICVLDDEMCKSYIDAIIQWHLTDPEKNKLLLNWRKWIYCQALKLESSVYQESDVWEELNNITEFTALELEEFTSCSGKPDNVIKSLEILANDYLSQRSFERRLNGDFDTFLNILKKHCNDAQLLKIKLNELQRIKPRGVNIHSVLTVIINDIHSEEALEEVKIYVENLKDTEIKLVVDPLLQKIRQRYNNIRLKKHNIRFRKRVILAFEDINE